MVSNPPTIASPLATAGLQRTTSNIRGTALINGTQNLASYTTPADGNAHLVFVAATQTVTSLETGGVVQVTYTSNGQALTAAMFPGGSAAGTLVASATVAADPGTTVTLVQSSALTVGAATVTADLSSDHA